MPMRILHLSSLYAPYSFGGAERVVQELAETTARRGLAVSVTSVVPAPQPASELNGVHVRPLRHRNPLWIETYARHSAPVRQFNKVATLLNPLTARDFAQLVAEIRPDVVHSHAMVTLTPFMWKIAKEGGARTVHTLHDYDLACIRANLFADGHPCTKQHLACAIFSKIKMRYHEYIDHVVGVSAAILDKHLHFGFFSHVPEQNRHVIWNPTSMQALAVGAHARAAFSSQPMTFGYLGRLVPEKGISILLAACHRLGNREWRLRIAGKAPLGDDVFRSQAEGLPVEFLGQTDPEAFLDGIDVLVVPPLWDEPFGLTVIEAYARGVPVIGTGIAGTAEIIREVDSTWLVPPDDPQALAVKMISVIDRGREALAGFTVPAKLLERTDPGFVVDEYLRVYGA